MSLITAKVVFLLIRLNISKRIRCNLNQGKISITFKSISLASRQCSAIGTNDLLVFFSIAAKIASQVHFVLAAGSWPKTSTFAWQKPEAWNLQFSPTNRLCGRR
jgi:hypothetical protein